MKYIISIILIVMVAMILPFTKAEIGFDPNNFTMTVNTSSNFTSQFFFSTTTNNTYQIFTNSIFPINLSTTSVKEPKWIQFYYFIPDNFPAGTYKYGIFFLGSNETKVINMTTIVNEQKTYSINVGDMNISTGSKEIKTIFIKNTGNVPLPFLNTINSSFISQPLNITVYPGLVQPIPLFFDIPKDAQPANYLIDTGITEGNSTFKFNITVKDDSPPEIEEFTFNSSVKWTKPQKMKLKATDNIKINSVEMKTNDKLFSFVKNNDTNEWSYEFVPEIFGENPFIVFVNDTSGNVRSKVEIFNVVKLEGVNLTLEVNRKIKSDFTASSKIGNIEDPVDVKLLLETLKFIPRDLNNTQQNPQNESLSYDFFVEAGAKRFDLDKGRAIDVKGLQGELNLVFRGKNPGFYEGKLVFQFDDKITEKKELKFYYSVGEYTVTESYENFIGSVKISCKGQDAGIYENSSYLCQYNLPVDTDLNKVGVFTTQAQLDTIKLNYDYQLTTTKTQLKSTGDIMNITVALIIIIVCGVLIRKLITSRGIRFKL